MRQLENVRVFLLNRDDLEDGVKESDDNIKLSHFKQEVKEATRKAEIVLFKRRLLKSRY